MSPTIAGTSTNNFFELVDLMPTLTELARLPVPPTCPPLPAALHVKYCTEGHSAAALVRQPNAPNKTAAFSQYSRPSLTPANNSDLPDLEDIQYSKLRFLCRNSDVCLSVLSILPAVGHTIRTDKHRYTEWRRFDPESYQTDWRSAAAARELYDHDVDSEEQNNLCFIHGKQDCGSNLAVADKLATKLKAGWRTALPNDILHEA
eukprot:SAG31_NODE_1833_length_7137_cov_2.587667_4_plen_204_part_00